MKLRELEKRLEKEPKNLGLRVTVAGLLHEAGRSVEAVELYRSVALAYRDMGRRQQAIAVCKSILGLAPEDESCQSLLASLSLPAEVTPPAAAAVERPSPGPARRSSMDPTPLPKPVPYDTTSSARLVSAHELDLPTSEGADTRPGSEPHPDASGLAQAARRISGWISGNEAAEVLADDLSAEIETQQRPRLDPGPPSESQTTIPTEKLELEDAVTPVRDSEELTRPRDLLPARDKPKH